MRRPRAVFLDVGGVLQLPEPVLICRALADIYPVSAARVDYAHYAAVATFDEPPRSNTEYLTPYASALGVPEHATAPAVAALVRAFSDGRRLWTKNPPSSLRGLAALASTGVRLGIISNADGTVEERLRAQGVVQVGAGPGVNVEVVVDSARVGVEKPDPRIFAHAVRALGDVDADEAWYVGDVVPVDVEGARGAGLVPFLFDPFGVHRAQVGVTAVGSLGEIARMIRRA